MNISIFIACYFVIEKHISIPIKLRHYLCLEKHFLCLNTTQKCRGRTVAKGTMRLCLVLLSKPCSQLRLPPPGSFTGASDPWTWRQNGEGQPPMALSKTWIWCHTTARKYCLLHGCWQGTSCLAITSFKVLLYMIYFLSFYPAVFNHECCSLYSIPKHLQQ